MQKDRGRGTLGGKLYISRASLLVVSQLQRKFAKVLFYKGKRKSAWLSHMGWNLDVHQITG